MTLWFSAHDIQKAKGTAAALASPGGPPPGGRLLFRTPGALRAGRYEAITTLPNDPHRPPTTTSDGQRGGVAVLENQTGWCREKKCEAKIWKGEIGGRKLRNMMGYFGICCDIMWIAYFATPPPLERSTSRGSGVTSREGGGLFTVFTSVYSYRKRSDVPIAPPFWDTPYMVPHTPSHGL